MNPPNTPAQNQAVCGQLACFFARFAFLFLGLAVATDIIKAADASARGLLLVANKGDQTLSIIDPVAGKQIATVSEDGITGHEVAASPDGKRAFVPIYGNGVVGNFGTDGSLVRVIDIGRREIVGTVDFGHGVRPHCAVMCAKTGLLYVTNELDQCVAVIDPVALKVVGTVPTGQKESHMLAISRDGHRGYTANVADGSISVLDLDARKLITVIPVTAHVQRISLSADDTQVFTSDQSQPRLAVIDTSINAISSWIDLPGLGFGTAATPDGKSLLVCVPSKNLVVVVDLSAKKVVRTFDVPKAPQELLVRPDGGVAFVSCDASRKVAVIDLKNWAVAGLIGAGPTADGLAWAATE